MIEIRVNNGVIQYRHRLQESLTGTVARIAEWSDWQKADVLGPVTPMEHRFTQPDVKVWFDAREGLTPEYWAAMANAAAGKGDGMQAADNWRRAYEKAVQNMRNQARRHSDELQAERKKVEQRDRQVRTVREENDAMAKHIEELKGMINRQRKDIERQAKDIERLSRECDNLNRLKESQTDAVAYLHNRNADAVKEVALQREQKLAAQAMLKTAEQTLLARQAELKAAREERDHRVQVENRSLHDTLLARQDELTRALAGAKRFAFRSGRARELLKRARAVIAMFTPAGKSSLLDDIDAELKD